MDVAVNSLRRFCREPKFWACGVVRGLLVLGVSLFTVCCSSLLIADEPASAEGGAQQEVSYEWPLSKLSEPAAPSPRDGSWCQNPIDGYLLQGMEEKGIRPSPRADKLTLLRRITLDLTGLLPTTSEQEAFLADQSPDAYQRVVDRLLQSVSFGQRFAQPWLDLVRYSEGDGFKTDALRPFAYKYRDYVIGAFNQDLPYDVFLRQQLAGDELEPDNPIAQIATGYNRLYPDELQASDIVTRRQELLDDVTDVTGQAFLGLTVGCARCHDHKFDPIAQKDYYALQAFFTPMIPRDDLASATREQEAAYQAQLRKWEEATLPIRVEMDGLLATLREQKLAELVAPYDKTTKEAIATPTENRSAYQQQLVCQAQKFMAPRMKRIARNLEGEAKENYDALEKQLATFDHLKPAELPGVLAVIDVGLNSPDTFLLDTGNVAKPVEKVEPSFMKCIEAEPVAIEPMPQVQSSGRRAALARWLTQARHPLTSRVMTNRIWTQLMGEGIVATPSDFGVMGQAASNKALLDWLAIRFEQSGYSVKEVVELIVTSNAYQMTSSVDPGTSDQQLAKQKDPTNKLLWHARRKRLDGETIRDVALQLSGELNEAVGGPSSCPTLPAALQESRYSWEADTIPGKQNRRSAYVITMRNMRYPLFEAFDQPDRINSCPQRLNTTSAPQSLVLLNGPLNDYALNWAKRLTADGSHPRAAVDRAYQELYARLPTPEERTEAQAFLEQQTRVVAEVPVASATQVSTVTTSSSAEVQAMADLCHALLLSGGSLFVD